MIMIKEYEIWHNRRVMIHLTGFLYQFSNLQLCGNNDENILMIPLDHSRNKFRTT